jgi:hypothetical protein
VVSCISLISVSYGSVAGCDFSDRSILVMSTNSDYSMSFG